MTNDNPHTYKAGTRLSSLYTMGRDGKPFPPHGGDKTSQGYRAWLRGQRDRNEAVAQTPDFFIKDEGEFALVYPNNDKAMAFLKSLKTAHWYSEKSVAIGADAVGDVTALLNRNEFTVENC